MALWLGIALDAMDRARSFVRAEARRRPGVVPPAALRLAELFAVLQGLRANVSETVRAYGALMEDREALASMGVALRRTTSRSPPRSSSSRSSARR